MSHIQSKNLSISSSRPESATISAPLTPTQRADLASIRQSMRDMRREIDEWTVVSNGLHRALKEIINCPWLKLDASMMSFPMDTEMLDDILERASEAMSKYASKIIE